MENTFSDKVAKTLTILASVCTISGTSIWGILTYLNSKTDEKNEYSYEVSVNEDTTENIGKDSADNFLIDTVDNFTSDNYSLNSDVQIEKNSEVINVEDEVKRIKNDYYNIQNQKGEPYQHPINTDVKIYYVLNRIVSIEVANGYNDIGYSRTYYFDEEGKLYFSFVFDKKRENRLYFKNDILIRYIDENGEIYNLYENLETCTWYELVLYESYELLKSVN